MATLLLGEVKSKSIRLFKYPSVAVSLSLDLFRWQFYEVFTHSRKQAESSDRNVM